MEELKPLAEILAPDFRASCRGFTLEVLHKLAAAHDLSPAVPESVRHQFEIARHAYVYSSLYTPLCAATELYAALAVELALRLRYEKSTPPAGSRSPRGLKDLLTIAVAEGWIADDGFDIAYLHLVATEDGAEYRQIPPEDRRRPTDMVIEVLPNIRNSMAHGQPRMTLETGSTALQRAAEIINQLFRASQEK